MEKRPSTEAPIQRKTPSSSNNIDFDKHYEEEKKRNNQLLSTEDYIFVSSFEIFSSLFHPAQVWKTSARSISVSYFIAHLFVVLFVLVLFSWPYKNDALSFCAAWLVLSLYTSTRIISCFFFLFCSVSLFIRNRLVLTFSRLRRVTFVVAFLFIAAWTIKSMLFMGMHYHVSSFIHAHQHAYVHTHATHNRTHSLSYHQKAYKHIIIAFAKP